MLKSLFLHLLAAVVLRQNGIFFAVFVGSLLFVVNTRRRQGVVMMTGARGGHLPHDEAGPLPRDGGRAHSGRDQHRGIRPRHRRGLVKNPEIFTDSDKALLDARDAVGTVAFELLLLRHHQLVPQPEHAAHCVPRRRERVPRAVAQSATRGARDGHLESVLRLVAGVARRSVTLGLHLHVDVRHSRQSVRLQDGSRPASLAAVDAEATRMG